MQARHLWGVPPACASRAPGLHGAIGAYGSEGSDSGMDLRGAAGPGARCVENSYTIQIYVYMYIRIYVYM